MPERLASLDCHAQDADLPGITGLAVEALENHLSNPHVNIG
jgi:hypothetical protein